MCAQGTRRRRQHLWDACYPGCAAKWEKTQSCPLCARSVPVIAIRLPPGARHSPVGRARSPMRGWEISWEEKGPGQTRSTSAGRPAAQLGHVVLESNQRTVKKGRRSSRTQLPDNWRAATRPALVGTKRASTNIAVQTLTGREAPARGSDCLLSSTVGCNAAQRSATPVYNRDDRRVGAQGGNNRRGGACIQSCLLA